MYCKKFISVVLSFVIFISFMPGVVFAADSETGQERQGSGTEEDPYVITTREDLISINDDLSASYVVANDIDLGDANFDPIGSETEPFTGSLDGKEYEITNFTYITSHTNTAPVEAALFAATSGASIHDLKMSNVNIDVTALENRNTADVGVLSLNDSSSEFKNIEINGTIKAKADNVTAGGLICNADGTAVDNVHNDIDMTLTASGLLKKESGGVFATAKNCMITNCSMKGVLKAEDSRAAVGGIAGDADATEISDCVNYADITAHYCGGMAADTGLELKVEKCTNKGKLNGYKKGILGGDAAGIVYTSVKDLENKITITDCINEGEISGDDCDASGIGNAGSISGCVNRGTISGENVKGIGTGLNELTDCINYADVTGSDEAFGIGGVGKKYTGCINYGDVTQASGSGIAGTASGICLEASEITRCFNYGKIEGSTACGIVKLTTDNLSECFNSGCITASTDAGGIALNNTDLIINSYNNGCIKGENAAGIVTDNGIKGVVAGCYNVGAVEGNKLSAGIAVNNKNEVIDSYYFYGTETGVANNETDAKNETVPLTNPMLTDQSSYKNFDFIDRSGPWVMSSISGMPKLACMSDEEDVYIESAAIQSYPSTIFVNRSFAKGAVRLNVNYSNGKSTTVRTGYVYEPYQKTVGKRTITLNFAGKTLSYQCTFLPEKVGKIQLKRKGKKITLKIPKTAGAAKYQIYRSTKKSKGFKLIATTAKTKFVDKKKIKAKKKYYYKVRAINGPYAGAFSNVYGVKKSKK